jgi:hypothetical protein
LPASLKRLEHEYALKAELDATWAARPIELSGHNNRMTLVLEDPGGELLDRPLAIPEVLRIAIPFARALGRVHANYQAGRFGSFMRGAKVLRRDARGALSISEREQINDVR